MGFAFAYRHIGISISNVIYAVESWVDPQNIVDGVSPGSCGTHDPQPPTPPEPREEET